MKVRNIDTIPKQQTKSNRKKVAIGSVVGSTIGIAGEVAGVYAMARKGNPGLAKKNLKYNEKDAFIIGTGAVLGGLVGGLAVDRDKNNVKPKLRESLKQLVGNMVFPLGTLAIGNKILEKSKFKMPNIKSSSKPAKIANTVLNALPRVVVTTVSLMGGMEIGNKVMNKVNNKIFKEQKKPKMARPEDYLVHSDDVILTANMLLKDAKNLSRLTSKILPLTFIVAGSKSGMKQNDNKQTELNSDFDNIDYSNIDYNTDTSYSVDENQDIFIDVKEID